VSQNGRKLYRFSPYILLILQVLQQKPRASLA
jgi:hypothetical protein